VTGAEGHGGMIYNFSLERSARERPSRFFRETDADDVKRLVEQATAWIREHA
jgi:hypothetical protein